MLLATLLILSSLYSQDNYGYITKTGTLSFYRDAKDASKTVLGMNEIGSIVSKIDGFIVVFYLTTDFSTQKQLNELNKLIVIIANSI